MTIQTISSAHRDKSGDFVLNSLHFARQLKEKGLPVTLGRTLDALRGLRLIRIEDKEAAYSLFSTHYVSRPEELAVFDAVFEAFWCAKGHPEASEAKRSEQSECNLTLTLPEEMAPSADHAENERPKIS